VVKLAEENLAGGATPSPTPTTATQVRQAELIALQQIATTLQNTTEELVKVREQVNSMCIDIALIKERQVNQAKTSQELESVRSRVEALELRRHQQDGAMTFAKWLKDFGPWVLAGAAALWTYVRSLTP